MLPVLLIHLLPVLLANLLLKCVASPPDNFVASASGKFVASGPDALLHWAPLHCILQGIIKLPGDRESKILFSFHKREKKNSLFLAEKAIKKTFPAQSLGGGVGRPTCQNVAALSTTAGCTSKEENTKNCIKCRYVYKKFIIPWIISRLRL